MALTVYSEADPTTGYSSDATFSNPLRQSFDGRVGGVTEQLYYMRNDSKTEQYEVVTLTPVTAGSSGRNIVDGTDGYSWKLFWGDTQPLDEEWDTIEAANTITFNDFFLGDDTTYQPFWLRIEVPAGASVESFRDATLEINATKLS